MLSPERHSDASWLKPVLGQEEKLRIAHQCNEGPERRNVSECCHEEPGRKEIQTKQYCLTILLRKYH